MLLTPVLLNTIFMYGQLPCLETIFSAEETTAYQEQTVT
jgi:hypothetical protein